MQQPFLQYRSSKDTSSRSILQTHPTHVSIPADLCPSLPRKGFSDCCVMSLRCGVAGREGEGFSTWYSWTCLANPLRLPRVDAATRQRLSFISHCSPQSSTEVQHSIFTLPGARGGGSYGLPVVSYMSSWLMWQKLWSHYSVFPCLFPDHRSEH